MRITSANVPQADLLSDVMRTVVCVSEGGSTYQDIAGFIGKGERQGRYYRKAAEILGFILTPSTNSSALTPLGELLIETGPTIENELVLQAVLNAHVFQRVIPFFENNNQGLTKSEIINYLASVSDIPETAESMLPRRFSSVISWLETLGLIDREGQRYFLRDGLFETIPRLEFTHDEEPILPSSGELHEYEVVETRVDQANEAVLYYKSLAALERANNSHIHLVNLVSERIRNSGSLPRFNQFIDLAARIGERDYIFEMKSTTVNNVKSQVRKGLSQLYEYRYLQNIPEAQLVLVLENPLPQEMRWIHEYMEIDRGIHLIWDGDNSLYSTPRTNHELNFLF